MTAAAIFVVFPLCLAIAALSDMFTMTIPNRVPAILLASFVIIAPLAGLGLGEVAMHLMAGLLVFCVCFALFAFNVMGGGDAKLLTASAVWFGFNVSLFGFMIYVALFGGILTFAILMPLADELHPGVGPADGACDLRDLASARTWIGRAEIPHDPDSRIQAALQDGPHEALERRAVALASRLSGTLHRKREGTFGERFENEESRALARSKGIDDRAPRVGPVSGETGGAANIDRLHDTSNVFDGKLLTSIHRVK